MKNQKENWFASNRLVLVTFVLSALIMLLTYILRGVYPFGDNIVLKVDLYHQYAPFHEELRSRILNGQSLFYSWEGGLGKEFITQIAYYTASPISILILLFPQSGLPEALAFFILIKIAFAGAFFAYYLKKTFDKNDLSIVAFGVMYAFTAYVTGYYWNVMWLDAVALFPIVAMGIERLIKEDTHLTYCISLALVIVINFYIAFLVCIFAVLYFLVVLFSTYTWKRDKQIIIARTIKFGVISAIAGGISMFLTIPTAIALSHTDTSDTNFPKFEFYKNVYQLITNHFVGARPVVLARNEDLPNVYSGVFTMLLLPFYFFNKKFKTKEKVLFGALILFMLLCSCVKPLDYMIHGFHFPSNLPHRYTFIYSFVILVLSYRGLLNMRSVDISLVIKAAIFYLVVMLFTEYVIVRSNAADIDRVLSDVDIIINIVLMVIYIIIMYSYKGAASKSDFRNVLTALLVVVVVEAAFSSYQGLDRTTSRDSYVKYIDSANEAVDYLDEKENGEFYRTEFRRFTTINDAALYHYNGFSQFSSLASGGISNMIGNLGIAATGNSYRYYDPTALIDAMFDLKYVMNKASDDGNGEIKNERYDYLTQFGNVWIYENKRVLPLGFMVNSAVKDWQTTDSMPFDVQNDFISKAAGVYDKMFTDIPLTSFDYTYMNITEKVNENYYKYELTDPANLGLIPTVTVKIKSDKDQYLYLYVDAGNAKRVKYVTDSANEDRELSAGKSLFDIGNVKKDEEITVTFELTNKGEFEKTYRKSGNIKVYAASYDDAVFQKAYDELNKNTYNITSFEDTRIEGNVNAAEDGVMFTSIPYNKGWSAYVDGEKTELVSIGDDGVIGVDVPKGEHEVTLTFEPQGFYAGCIISLISLIAAFVVTKFVFKKKKEAVNN